MEAIKPKKAAFRTWLSRTPEADDGYMVSRRIEALLIANAELWHGRL